MADLRFAFYGDDFTGATDTLATLASAGLNTVLFMGPPTPAQLASAGALDCLGIAGASRSMRGAEQAAELEQVGRFFTGLEAPVIHYKTCSTFDSSPDIGSIGNALRSLRRQLSVSAFVPIVGGQPNLDRYCVFGNLFAAFQAGKEIYRLDRHPTMSRHPVTPMHEADLRLHLAKQGLTRVGLVPYPGYDLPAEAFDRMLEDAIDAYPDGILFDVAHAGHLDVIGRAIWQHAHCGTVLAAGPSSVAQALIAHWRMSEEPAISLEARPAKLAVAAEPVFVFSGSRSPLTAKQIQAGASYERIPLAPATLMASEGSDYGLALARILASLDGGANVLAYLTNEASETVDSAAGLAQACAAFIARIVESGRPRRMGVAGGDTSSYAVKALDCWGLSYLGQLDPGAALCRMHSDDPAVDGVEIMLKGGQMGSTSIFEKLLRPEAR